MSRRLGEQLVTGGELSRRQLEEAMETQLMSGGGLDTCLLDMGYVDEETLTGFLAADERAEPAEPESLRDIEEETISTLTPEQAEKFLAIPLSVDDETIVLAGTSVRRHAALGRILGREVVTRIAPEVRIHEALNRYYGKEMNPRHARLVRELDGKRRRRRHNAAVAEAVAVGAAAGDAPAPVPRVDPASIDRSPEFGYGRDWRSVAAELGETLDAEGAAEAPSASGESRGTTEAPRDLATLLDRLCTADCKEDLSDAILDFLHRTHGVSRAVLFAVRSQVARVWDWRGGRLDATRVGALRLPVGGGSILGLLLGRDAYRGPVEGDAAARRFFESLGVESPVEVALRPVYVSDRLVAVLYVDRGSRELTDDDERRLKELADKLSLGLSLLILKKKIRAR